MKDAMKKLTENYELGEQPEDEREHEQGEGGPSAPGPAAGCGHGGLRSVAAGGAP